MGWIIGHSVQGGYGGSVDSLPTARYLLSIYPGPDLWASETRSCPVVFINNRLKTKEISLFVVVICFCLA